MSNFGEKNHIFPNAAVQFGNSVTPVRARLNVAESAAGPVSGDVKLVTNVEDVGVVKTFSLFEIGRDLPIR